MHTVPVYFRRMAIWLIRITILSCGLTLFSTSSNFISKSTVHYYNYPVEQTMSNYNHQLQTPTSINHMFCIITLSVSYSMHIGNQCNAFRLLVWPTPMPFTMALFAAIQVVIVDISFLKSGFLLSIDAISSHLLSSLDRRHVLFFYPQTCSTRVTAVSRRIRFSK